MSEDARLKISVVVLVLLSLGVVGLIAKMIQINSAMTAFILAN